MITTVFLLLFISCARNQKEADLNKTGYPVQEEIVDGIKTIMNPDFPRDGQIKYKMADVITLGGEEGPEEGMLFYPYKIRVDTQNNIYVLDIQDKKIKIYDDKGNWVHNIGGRGQGPGEFMAIGDFDVSHDCRIFVSDLRQSRISILRTDGSFLSSFIMRSCERLRVDEQGQIYLQQFISSMKTVSSDSRDYEIFIKRVDSKGKNLYEFGKFKDRKFVQITKIVNGETHVSRHFSPEGHITVWIVGKNCRLFLGYSRDYIFTVLNKNGKSLFKFGRKLIPILHPLYSPDLAHPRYYPAFYDSRYLFFDDENNLWLRQYTQSEHDGRVYDVFSPEGIFIWKALVPATILCYQDGKAYSIVELDSGLYETTCYKLIESE